MKEYLPKEICRICGGKCCKQLPAPYIPKDIKRIFGSVENAINSKIIAIDWWEGNYPLYFLRPKIKGVDNLFDPSWGGECIHLSDKGCLLSRDRIPFLCKALEPIGMNNCIDHCKIPSKKYAGLLWKKEKINFDHFRV